MSDKPDIAEPVAQQEPRDPHFGGHSYEASMLRDLLAVIHRDGGHYVAQHGLDKAVEDAHATITALREQVAQLEAKALEAGLEIGRVGGRAEAAERDAAEYRALLKECLDAWTGEGPAIVLDRIRAKIGDKP